MNCVSRMMLCVVYSSIICLAEGGSTVAEGQPEGTERTPNVSDWLVTPWNSPVELQQHQDKGELVLSNGLIRRSFRC